jgi:hypothetical protein
MRNRFGGVLALVLGAVLIAAGLNDRASGVAGTAASTCGMAAAGTVTPGCAAGDFVIRELTDPAPGAGDPQPPTGGWTITVTSPCTDPGTQSPTSAILPVPDDGTVESRSFEIFTDATESTKCSYDLVETPVAGYTASVVPAPPLELQLSVQTHVTVTNSFGTGSSTPTDGPPTTASAPVPTTASAPVPTTASAPVPTTASAPVPTALPPTTASASVPTDSEPTGSAGDPIGQTSGVPSSRPSRSSSPARQLAATGPRAVRVSLWCGIALCLLGAGLVFGGSRRRHEH